MPLNLEDKKALVAEVNAVAAKALSVVGAENRGLTVAQMTELARESARSRASTCVWSRTRWRARPWPARPFECISPALKGPLVLAFSKDDPGAAARVVKAFAKDHDKLVATLVSLGGQLLGPKDIEKVASLPTREQALAQLMGLMKAPISKLVRTLAEPQAEAGAHLAAYAMRRWATKSRPRRPESDIETATLNCRIG